MGTSKGAGQGGVGRGDSSTASAVLRPAQLTARPLAQLLAALSESAGLDSAQFSAAEGVTISGLSLNSKLVSVGDLYVALSGAKTHGAVFAEQAIQAGALAVLTDASGTAKLRGSGFDAPVITVEDPRAVMAELAAELYGHPARRLAMCAITGTNGKTTTAYLLEAALAAAGRTPAVIGTIGFRVGGQALVGERTTVTTPESPDLQSLLALMAERGVDAVAMEVSSHAMVLGRTEPVIFDVAAFTNLGRDHLDFHAHMADYFEAKASLFTPAHARVAVVNIDGEWGERLAERVRRAHGDDVAETPPLVTTGRDVRADFRLIRTRHNPDQSQDLVIQTPRGELCTTLGLPGEYNADNAVTALAIIDSLGLDPFQAQAGLRAVQVPGRMQRLALPPGSPTVIVDFAHTPQAITSVLAALRMGALRVGAPGTGGTGPGRVIAVLGAGGDRDAAKRGPMGAEAAHGADVVIVTDDNPRGEDPAAIRAAVLAGAAEVADAGGDVQVLDGGERRAALRLALRLANTCDVIAVLGKGHERGQEIAGTVGDFADADVVVELATDSGLGPPGTDQQVAR